MEGTSRLGLTASMIIPVGIPISRPIRPPRKRVNVEMEAILLTVVKYLDYRELSRMLRVSKTCRKRVELYLKAFTVPCPIPLRWNGPVGKKLAATVLNSLFHPPAGRAWCRCCLPFNIDNYSALGRKAENTRRYLETSTEDKKWWFFVDHNLREKCMECEQEALIVRLYQGTRINICLEHALASILSLGQDKVRFCLPLWVNVHHRVMVSENYVLPL